MSTATLELPVLEAAEKKANHRANIVRIDKLRAHTNADSLSLFDIPDTDYQVVVRKGQFSVGDFAVYIQPDSIIPQTKPFDFIWEGHVGLDGTVPDKRRRITVRKFRGEWSEGLLLPTVDFDALYDERGNLKHEFSEGDDVSDLLGIGHYDPDTVLGTGGQKLTNENAPKRKYRYPRSFRGWFNFVKRLILNKGRVKELTQDVSFVIPTYDVEGFRNYPNAFIDGEDVVVTEKIHGSNARFIFLDDTMYAGSRNQWKAPGSNSTWHKALRDNPWIESWCRENPGYAIYGEVAPTQKGFTYGAEEGQVKFFAFDILTPEKTWVGFDKFNAALNGEGQVTDSVVVPLLYKGPFNRERILKLVDGVSWVRKAGHIREGIVIKTTTERSQRGLGRTQLKVVSNAFLEKDSK